MFVILREQLNQEKAQKIVRTFQDTWETAYMVMKQAQNKKKQDINL
jgi:hypothetical protein